MLAREPGTITAGEVVRALEGPIEPQICTAEGDAIVNCVHEPNCGTRLLWVKLQATIATALDGFPHAHTRLEPWQNGPDYRRSDNRDRPCREG